MKINLKIWEASQRMIQLRYEEAMDCGFDDTSDLYDCLMEEIPPHQVDNFYEIICRDLLPINLNDCFVDSDYNAYRVVLCDIDNQVLKLMVNGSEYLQESNLVDSSDYIMKNFKLVKLEEYYDFLDIIWECKDGMYFDRKDIKRIDFKVVI